MLYYINSRTKYSRKAAKYKLFGGERVAHNVSFAPFLAGATEMRIAFSLAPIPIDLPNGLEVLSGRAKRLNSMRSLTPERAILVLLAQLEKLSQAR